MMLLQAREQQGFVANILLYKPQKNCGSADILILDLWPLEL